MYGSITSKDLDTMSPAAGMVAPPPSAPAQPATRPPVPVGRGPMTDIPMGSAYADVPVSNVRGVIAKRLLLSKTSIPHYYLTVDINVDKLLALRAKFNKKLEKEGVKLSVNDFVIKALAMASKKVPEANSAWMDSVIRV